MESSPNNTTASPAADGASRRRSGRVVRAPDMFVAAPATSKRKRGNGIDDEDLENESPDEDDQPSDEDDEDMAEEGPAPRQRKKKASSQPRLKKPAMKKPKINGTSAAHASSLPSRPKKTTRIALDVEEGEGLYADVFGSGDSADDVVGRWYATYQEAMTPAMAELVNCILQAAGCDQQITEDDINDPDNCANRLTELQGLYEDQQITEYPLIARSKGTKSFRDLLVGFFKSLVEVLHATDVLYQDALLMENIVRWIVSMSSSTLRPFRHTATTVALALMYSLVEVAKKLDGRITKLTQQIDGEKSRQGKKKDKSSKAKLAVMQNNLNEANQSRDICGEQMKEFFDTVFVHRYRDVDPKIRTECVEALGSWIWVLPNVYMEPEYLRYLGWMLSDITPSTRQEVLMQLARVFKRDAQKLGHFIDRFRPRLVEIATQDSDIGVRVTAISVIENLRATGMLEPDEIDAIGKLIFDSELKVRKAVVTFFADCVKDLLESKLEEVGGEEAIQELFSEEQDAFDLPRQQWLNIKCLAETLTAYEAQLEDEMSGEGARGMDVGAEMLNAAIPETRISLASQVLFDKIPEVNNWEILAGYLLYDHSLSTKSRTKAKDRSTEAIFKAAVTPAAQEESILLEVLASAVNTSLAHAHDSEKQKKRLAKAEGVEPQEDAALHLAMTIPKLLKKFGGEPLTATIVLRLEHSLDLDVFQQLRQDSTTYARLLDEICTQFDRHVDRAVVSEATAALLHARQYDELEEIADSRVSTMWENLIATLRALDTTCELSARGNLDVITAIELSNVLFKISKLASVSDCVDILEAEGTSIDSSSPVIDIIVKTVHRGRFIEPSEDLDNIEDELTANAIRCSQFYFMWKARSILKTVELQTDLPNVVVDRLAILKRTFQVNVIHTFSSRAFNDDLRLFATGSLFDLCSLFGSLSRAVDQPLTAEKYRAVRTLIQEIPPGLVNELISVLDGAERSYAKKSKKTLNEPAEDEDPLDDDQLDDDEDDEDLSPEDRRAAELKAERSLCDFAGKLVLTLLAKMVDQSGPQAGKLKRRLLRNQAKLGSNFKEIVAYLDESKLQELAAGGKKKSSRAKGKEPAVEKRAEEVVVVVDDGAEDPFASPEPEEGTEEDLRRRELLEDPIEPEEDEDEGHVNDGMDEDDDVLGD